MNVDRSLICSATRVAPAVRTCDTRWVAVAVGFCLDVERLRVWENAVEGAKRVRVNKVVATSFKVCVSSSTVLDSNRVFLLEG